MKVLLTLNMPNAQGHAVHQITVEHEAQTIDDFCDALNDNEFITVGQWYRYKQPDGSYIWQERGTIVVNTSVIGKVQEYIENEKDEYDETYRPTNISGSQPRGTRGPIRPGRTSI